MIEWLNCNVYIMIVIEGMFFCNFVWNVLAFMVKNVAVVVIVNIVGDIMFVFGKLVVVLGFGMIVFLMFDVDMFNYGDEKVFFSFFIVIVVVLFVFIIVNVFMFIVEFGIDIILFCYCKDCDDNNGVLVNVLLVFVKIFGMLRKIVKMKVEEVVVRDERAG